MGIKVCKIKKEEKNEQLSSSFYMVVGFTDGTMFHLPFEKLDETMELLNDKTTYLNKVTPCHSALKYSCSTAEQL